jgi:hypothetical protein
VFLADSISTPGTVACSTVTGICLVTVLHDKLVAAGKFF